MYLWLYYLWYIRFFCHLVMEIQWMSKKKRSTRRRCSIRSFTGGESGDHYINSFYMFLSYYLWENILYVCSSQVNAGSSNPIPNGSSHRYKKKQKRHLYGHPRWIPGGVRIYEETNDFFQWIVLNAPKFVLNCRASVVHVVRIPNGLNMVKHD